VARAADPVDEPLQRDDVAIERRPRTLDDRVAGERRKRRGGRQVGNGRGGRDRARLLGREVRFVERAADGSQSVVRCTQPFDVRAYAGDRLGMSGRIGVVLRIGQRGGAGAGAGHAASVRDRLRRRRDSCLDRRQVP
jgi:hypothetical protein